MNILAIETSCDETAVAILNISSNRFKLLSNVVSSQIKIHAKYGGIVPEVAARKQIEMIIPVVEQAVKQTNHNNERRINKLINYIAVTNGPGLITSLRVGVETAKILAWAWKKPLIGVNHLEGHIFSNFLPKIREIQNQKSKIQNFNFPVLALIVSGGHTLLVLMKKHLHYQVIGETLDDAAGEAFDKVAQILNLGYPGGPIISKLAQIGKPNKFKLPRPMLSSNDLNFSFSGLKTAVLYTLQKNKKDFADNKLLINDLCASFEQSVTDVLINKTIKAAKKFKVKTVLLGGGVAANKKLRADLQITLKNKLPEINYSCAPIEYCGDNAAMIAVAAYYKAKAKKFTNPYKIKTDSNLRI